MEAEQEHKLQKRILNYVQIIVGCFITAFSVNCILVPNKLSTSGVTGLSQMAERFYRDSLHLYLLLFQYYHTRF